MANISVPVNVTINAPGNSKPVDQTDSMKRRSDKIKLIMDKGK